MTYHDMQIDRVCLKYAVEDGKLVGVMVRGITEDILPILDAGVVNRIGAQILAAQEWNAECARQDEGVQETMAQFAERINYSFVTGKLQDEGEPV